MSYSASLDRDHIDRFKASWPCHGLPASLNRLWFQFDARGDLVDYGAWSRNGRRIEIGEDGNAAFLALCEDAQRTMHPEHADQRYGKRS